MHLLKANLRFDHKRYLLSVLSLCCILISRPSFAAGTTPELLQKAEEYLSTNPDSSFYYAISFIESRTDQTKKEDLTYAYYIAGSAEYLFGNLSYSDSLLVACFKYSKGVSDNALLGICNQLYAKILKVEKRFESSMYHLMQAKDYFEMGTDPLKKIELTIDIAEFYRATANFEKANEYIALAEEQERKLTKHDDGLLADLQGRKAAILDETGKIDDALRLSISSVELSEKSGDFHATASGENEIGFILWKKGDDKCVDHYNKAISLWEKINYHYYKANAKLNLARTYLGKKEYEKARELLFSTLDESVKKGWKGIELGAHQNIIDLLKAQGKTDEIPPHLIRSLELDLYITRESSSLSLLDMQEKYSAEQNKRTALEKDQEVKDAEYKLQIQSKYNIYLSVAVGLAFFLGAGVSLLISRRKRA